MTSATKGGHLDVTRRARAGTLANRVTRATSRVHMVSALHFGFRLFELIRSKYLPAGLHGGMGTFHRGALLEWCLLWLLMSLGVGI